MTGRPGSACRAACSAKRSGSTAGTSGTDLTDELGPYVDWVPYCPEVSIGLGTPREPIRLTADGRLAEPGRHGRPHGGAWRRCPCPPGGLDGYVFKAKSPSCGIRAIPRYDQDGLAARHDGRGLYADRVLTAFPLLAVEDEGRLNDAGLREAFCERIFATARLRSLFSGPWPAGGPGGPPRPAQAAAAGARPGALPGGGQGRGRGRGTEAAYRDLFLAAMASRATDHRERAAARVQPDKRQLDRPRRLDLVARIEAYRRGEEPLERAGRAARALRERRGGSAGWRSKPSSGPFRRN